MLGFKTLFRLLALFSCVVALISTSLCFFAGIKRTKLDNINILTVRICFLISSRIFLTFVDKYINVASQRYSYLLATNSSIPTALSSMSQSIETILSLRQIALRMIEIVSEIFATLYALGFFITALAFVGFLGSPGGRLRTTISVMLSCVSYIPRRAHYINSQLRWRASFMG